MTDKSTSDQIVDLAMSGKPMGEAEWRLLDQLEAEELASRTLFWSEEQNDPPSVAELAAALKSERENAGG